MLLGTVLLLSQAAFPFFGAEARTSAVQAATNDSARHDKVIMLVVDGLSVDEFTAPSWTHLRAVASHGAIGLMSTRAAGPHTSPAAHVTIGAGVRSRSGSLTGLTLGRDEVYAGAAGASLYETLTGRPAEEAAALFVGAAQLFALAGVHPPSTGTDVPALGASPRTPMPGALGQALSAAGRNTAVIGNSDTFAAAADGALSWSPRRHGALLAMDVHGRIPAGDVSRALLSEDPNWPFGARTDYEATWQAFVSAYDEADLIVVELGDLARLDAYADWLPENVVRTLRQQTMRRIDEFVGRLLQWSPASGQLLLLVTPSPPAAALRSGFLLAPIMIATIGGEPESASPKLLSSNTTRRAGIVTNTDVTPTVLLALGVDASLFSGTRIAGVPAAAAAGDAPYGVQAGDDAWAAVRNMYERTILTNSLRGPVVRSFIGFSIAVFVGWIAWITYASMASVRGPEIWLPVWRWLLLLLMSAPLAIILLPLARPQDHVSAMVVLVVMAGVITTAAYALLRRRGTDAFVVLALVTAAVLLTDVALGSRLIKNSILGYDPIVAARFYGIGNEYMGVLIGTTLIGTTGLLDRWARRNDVRRLRWKVLAAALYAAVVAVLAAPSLGANVGGTIAAVVGLGTTLLLLADKQLSWKTLLTLFVGVALVVAVAALADVTLHREQPSHLGRALLAFADQGWSALAAIAARKLTMNLTLLRWTIWAQVFVVSLAISTVALYRPGPAVRQADRQHPFLLKGIRGAVVGALAALVANDSGVVAAATLMIPVTATLMYLMLVQRATAAKT